MHRELISESTVIPAAPLGGDEFAGMMQAFALLPAAPLALAVSGGPDSMALAFCVQLWAKTEKRAIVAFIVDHGLRLESACEAEETQKRLIALGITAEILAWSHSPVVARLHAVARKARYRLLLDACRRHGIQHLLLAHQREDQAETILMRFAKGSGINGLAGMPGRSVMEGIHILRPFLAVPKDRLIATCRTATVSFITDPSNASDKFARGRLRRVMPLLAEEGFTVERLMDLGARAADAAEALDHYMLALLRIATKRDETGAIRFDLEHLRSSPRAIALRALGVCLQAVHAEDYMPEHASLARLLGSLCADEDMPPHTLHGCLVGKNASCAFIMREYAAITEAPTLRAGESIVWDGRWRVTLDKKVGELAYEMRPLGCSPHDTIDRLASGLRHRVPQGRARASLPALWQEHVLALVPALASAACDRAPAYAQLLGVWPPVSL